MNKKQRKFENWMRNFYNTPYGSLIASVAIIYNIPITDYQIYAKLQKAKLPFIDDIDFINKTLKEFGFDIKNPHSLAVLQTDNNLLFFPVYKDKVLPYQRDGSYPASFFQYPDKIRRIKYND